MDRANVIRKWLNSESFPSEPEFFQTFVDESGKYILDEGSTWDFKQEWPLSYSDNYWGGIAKLICAFSNTFGGVIIFGVHDKFRIGGFNKVIINYDKLKSAFQQLTSAAASLDVKRYCRNGAEEVLALFVRARPICAKPIRFLKAIGPYQAGVVWVRDSYEAIEASPRHYSVLFCRAGPLLDETNTKDVQGSLPPSPTTLKRFVGRLEVMDKLFAWLQSSDEPRIFLFGKGGSGKTSIAYEFAKLIRNSGGELPIYGGHKVDTVIF